MVSFTEEFYIVDEGVDSGKVRVCVMVVPPVDFDFSVNFTTTEEGSAAGNTVSNFYLGVARERGGDHYPHF